MPARPARVVAVLAMLAAQALVISATPARADDAASLRILQQCVVATAPGPRTAQAAHEVPGRGDIAQGVRARHDGQASAGSHMTRRGQPSEPDAYLAARCPELARALADLGLATQIDIWNGKLDHNALEDLVRVAQRYAAPMPSVMPSVAMLPAALARLQTPPTPRRSWWQALKERIQQWLGQPGAAGADWLEQLLQQLSIPAWVARLILYGITAAVLLMALWIIGRELQAAGLLGPRGTRRRVADTAPFGVPAPSAAPGFGGITDVERAPLAERSILLLRLLVQALLQSGRLSAERALTYRELGERGDFDDADQRGRFARLAQLAERDRYGAAALQSDQWPGVAREGRTLYSQLRAPRTAGRSGAAAAAAPARTLGP